MYLLKNYPGIEDWFQKHLDPMEWLFDEVRDKVFQELNADHPEISRNIFEDLLDEWQR